MSYLPEYTAEVSLTSAQLLTLHSSPVLLAPGVPGTIIDIKSIYIEYLPGTVAYTVGASDWVTILTGSIPNALLAGNQFVVTANGFFNSLTSMANFGYSWWSGPFVGGSATPLSVVEGSGIYLYQFDSNDASLADGANWTGGNGSCKVCITYAYLVA